jgi:hypothetical protein
MSNMTDREHGALPPELPEVTRVVVVDADGRIFDETRPGEQAGVRIVVQDGGRTLKVLPFERKPLVKG